jgi:hypothetical protein
LDLDVDGLGGGVVEVGMVEDDGIAEVGVVEYCEIVGCETETGSFSYWWS